ncbi:hypothetical protein Q31b_06400 [Novipirellula aureliae]|uniref:Immunoglobulin G-binding protein A n=1 Tax=Novipirellula aureliae TaxID=2527966 RepID=A0A5C6E9E7_9BACT|nr:hypothetical protein [Novipirellula aureliae]TWU45468.1 hypothetical protein Q31b_06400 [Novipirellula aureliae]
MPPSTTAPSPSPARREKSATNPSPSFDAISELVESRIAEAQNALWWAELTRVGLKTLLGALVGVLLFVVIDQWIYSPGILLRVGWFGAWLVWMGWMIFSRIIPVLSGTICPEYAARSLERDTPEMRQELTSYVMLRDQRSDAGLRGKIVRSVGAHAAGRLKQNDRLPSEATGTIVWWLATAATLALFLVYAVVSPKSTLQSASRLVMPAASIAPAKRVAITDVQPGDAEVMAGRNVAISARVTGLSDDQNAWCRYRVGQQSREIQLLLNADTDRFVAELPLDFSSIGHASSSDIEYVIAAGDDLAGPFRLSIDDVPVVAIESVYYEPPSYVGKAPHSLTSPIIRGLDGTRVTLRVRTNRAVERAVVQFNPKPLGNIVQATAGVTEMKLDDAGTLATVSFPLRHVKGRSAAVQLEQYRIVVRDESGQTNPDPIIYPIDVIADLAPEITIVMPQQTPKDLPIDAQQVIEVHAADADFGLSQIELEVRRGIDVVSRPVLWEDTTGAKGNQVAEYRFRPLEHFLREGDSVEITAIATDNRSDRHDPLVEPNVTRTGEIVLRITQSEPLDDDPQGNDGMSATDDEPASNRNDSKQQEAGTQSGGSGGSGGDEATKQKSGEHEGGGQGSGQSQGDQQQNDQPQQGGKQESGEQQGGEQQGGEQQGGEQQGGEQQGGEQQGGEQQGGEQQGGEQQGGEQQGGEQQGGEQQGGEQQGGEQQGGEQQGGEQQGGEQQGGEQQGGEQQGGEPQPMGDGQQGSNENLQGDASSSAEDSQSKEPPKHDGEAFERIRDYLNKKRQAEQNGSAGEPQTQEDQQQNSTAGPSGDQNAANQGSQSQQNDEGRRGDNQSNQEPLSDQQDGKSGESSNDGSGVNQPNGETENGTSDQQSDSDGSTWTENEQSQGSGEAGDEGASATDSERKDSQDHEAGSEDGNQDGSNQEGQGQEGQGQEGQGQEGQGQEGQGQEGEGTQNNSEGADSDSGENRNESNEGTEAKGGDSEGSPSENSASSPPNSDQTPPPTDRSSSSQGSSGNGTGTELGENSTLSEPPPAPDPIDLEYAKKATDMVLDYLDETREAPDQELLEDLKWSEQDLKQFADRWKDAREMAPSQAADSDRQRDLQEALESLGLRPPTQTTNRRQENADTLGGIKDSGNRTPPPAAYRDAFESFRRAIGRKTP